MLVKTFSIIAFVIVLVLNQSNKDFRFYCFFLFSFYHLIFELVINLTVILNHLSFLKDDFKRTNSPIWKTKGYLRSYRVIFGIISEKGVNYYSFFQLRNNNQSIAKMCDEPMSKWSRLRCHRREIKDF